MKIKAAQRSKKVVLELEPGEPGLPPAPGAQITLKRILVPVDFSEASRKAVQYAVTFANQFNAEVLLLHIFEISLPLAQPFAFETGLPGARAREEAAKQLSQWRNELLSGIRSKAVVREHTSAPHEIVTAASENNADLIVLGTQGRTGLAHLLIGSTAERVVQYAHCPVLVVRERETDFIPLEPEVPAARTQGHVHRNKTKGTI